MTHIGQEFTLTLVGDLSLRPRLGVLLDRLAKIVYHPVDGRLERIHLAGRFDRDEASKVTVGGGRRDLGESAYLGREVGGHDVDIGPEVSALLRLAWQEKLT